MQVVLKVAQGENWFSIVTVCANLSLEIWVKAVAVMEVRQTAGAVIPCRVGLAVTGNTVLIGDWRDLLLSGPRCCEKARRRTWVLCVSPAVCDRECGGGGGYVRV